jgi:hypothetical protein
MVSFPSLHCSIQELGLPLVYLEESLTGGEDAQESVAIGIDSIFIQTSFKGRLFSQACVGWVLPGNEPCMPPPKKRTRTKSNERNTTLNRRRLNC